MKMSPTQRILRECGKDARQVWIKVIEYHTDSVKSRAWTMQKLDLLHSTTIADATGTLEEYLDWLGIN